jgi:ribosomal protein L32
MVHGYCLHLALQERSPTKTPSNSSQNQKRSVPVKQRKASNLNVSNKSGSRKGSQDISDSGIEKKALKNVGDAFALTMNDTLRTANSSFELTMKSLGTATSQSTLPITFPADSRQSLQSGAIATGV